MRGRTLGANGAVWRAMTAAMLFGFVCLGFGASSAWALKVAWMDAERNWHVVDDPVWPEFKAGAPGAVTLAPAKAGAVTFNITFLDVNASNGIGFDDAVNGAARRATFTSVFAYIGSLLNESGVCDVEVQVSQTDGTGFLASAGTSYSWFTSPQYLAGFAHDHITTGIDPGTGSDIRVTVDFGYPWHTGTGAPPGGQFDFFSVLLHEITHGLGIASITNSSGISQFMPSGNIFSTFDNQLYTGDGTKLWNSSCVFQPASTGCLTGAANSGVRYRGTNGMASYGLPIPIYTPSTYQPGSSISHWNNTGFSPEPVMDPDIAPTQVKRTFVDFEVRALKDLGYDLIADLTPPQIRVTGAVSCVRGDVAVAANVATVSDGQDAAGALLVNASGAPTGLTVGVVNNSGTVRATAQATTAVAANAYAITLTCSDSDTMQDVKTFNVIVGNPISRAKGSKLFE